MIDQKARMAEADQFKHEMDCYIHVEMKDGKNCEIVMAGGGLALLHGIAGVVERMGTLSDTPFDEILKAINDIHEANK